MTRPAKRHALTTRIWHWGNLVAVVVPPMTTTASPAEVARQIDPNCREYLNHLWVRESSNSYPSPITPLPCQERR